MLLIVECFETSLAWDTAKRRPGFWRSRWRLLPPLDRSLHRSVPLDHTNRCSGGVTSALCARFSAMMCAGMLSSASAIGSYLLLFRDVVGAVMSPVGVCTRKTNNGNLNTTQNSKIQHPYNDHHVT